MNKTRRQNYQQLFTNKLSDERMMKKKILGIIVACLILVLAISAILTLGQRAAFSKKDFPLEVDLSKRVFNLGEKISFNTTITNKSGRDVNMSSNGAMPCVFFHKINDNITHAEIAPVAYQILKANDKVSRVFEFEPSETGTYIIDAHYRISVNNIAIQEKIEDISIEIK